MSYNRREIAIDAISAIAEKLKQLHTIDGTDLWQEDEIGDAASRAHAELTMAIELLNESRDPAPIRLDPHHASIRLLLTQMTGAGMAVLHAINKAGGHVITDPQHQAPIGQALRALEKRVQEALDLPSVMEG